MNILNLYAGIGGNRKLWENVKVTAIENNKEIAKIYKDFFPHDQVIITDAHLYLLKNFDKFDFIWSSPPCPSHSRIRYSCNVGSGQSKPIYPSMELYQEIIFLKHNFKGKWIVENVISYYNPLIKPQIIDRHYIWSNFHIGKIKIYNNPNIEHGKSYNISDYHGFDLRKYKPNKYRKDQISRNITDPKIGLHIFNCAFKNIQQTLINI